MKKKILVVILILLIIVISYGIFIYPKNNNNIGASDAEVARVFSREFLVLPKKNMLFMSQIYQNDYDIKMKNSDKLISVDGCALTALTMASNYLALTNRSVIEANDLVGNYACVVNKGIFWYYASSLLNTDLQTVVYTNYFSSFFIKDEFVKYIDNNEIVIVGLYNMEEKVKTHFVVVYGYQGQNEFTYYIHDPNKLNDFKTLQEYFDAGWQSYEYLVFK